MISFYIDNLKRAIDVISVYPDAMFNLQAYRKCSSFTHGCGTLYCAAGLLAVTPHFMELGLAFHRDISIPLFKPTGKFLQAVGAENYLGTDTVGDGLDALFGGYRDASGDESGAFYFLFDQYALGLWDDELMKRLGLEGYCTTNRDHKRLALARLRKALDIREWEAS